TLRTKTNPPHPTSPQLPVTPSGVCQSVVRRRSSCSCNPSGSVTTIHAHSKCLRPNPIGTGSPSLQRRTRMAAKTSFKVQCHSCDAMVPIRDPNLVGKKGDCPKCKYRFVVEDPNPEADEADERPAKKGAAGKKAKKKAGSNNVVILGAVLGAVAVTVLG